MAEALWTPTGELVELPAPDTADVEGILVRVLRGAQKDFEDLEAPWPDDEYEAAQREALQRPLGLELPPSPPRRRVAVGAGFSLHADTAVHGNDRQGIERLCRYGARGPVSESRLRRLEDGRYQYTPKKGVTFTLTAEALVRRLVSLVPPAKVHLTSFHGVYAPHAALRPRVTMPPPPAPTSPSKETKTKGLRVDRTGPPDAHRNEDGERQRRRDGQPHGLQGDRFAAEKHVDPHGHPARVARRRVGVPAERVPFIAVPRHLRGDPRRRHQPTHPQDAADERCE